MKRCTIASAAVGLLAAFLSWTGCSQSSQRSANHGASVETTSTQSIQKLEAKNDETDEQAQEETGSRFSDAKAYCLGILLYAERHGYMFPSNLDQTLPYLSAANCLPSGTNHFDLLYRGSFNSLPNPMTNGIIVIRGEAFRTPDGRWMRVYGFADGHCEKRADIDGNFASWEQEHSLHP